MIFALATDEMSLSVFSTIEDALAYCEGIDVEDGSWQFWDATGVALSPEFISPNHRGRIAAGNGTYRLVPSPRLPSLGHALEGLKALETNRHFATLAAVREHLAAVVWASQPDGSAPCQP